MRRRSLISLVAAAVLSNGRVVGEPRASQRPREIQKTTLVNLIGTLHSPYDRWWSKGGELCAAAFDSPYVVLQSEGYFAKGFGQLSDLFSNSKGKGGLVLNVDAPGSPKDLRSLIDLCRSHEVYFVTQNNVPPEGLRPWDFNPYYVAHIDYDQRLAGLKTGRQLVTVMGGRGGVIVLSGKANTISADIRVSGLRAALSTAPACYLLTPPVAAEWEASAAYDVTRSLIAKFGNSIGGVWAANDDMALGAIEALRLYGLSVPVTGIDGTGEAVAAIQSGTMTATIAWDPFWQGGIGLALAVCAKNGLIVPSTEPHSHRAFYGPLQLVTADNVRDFVEYRDSEHPMMDWRDFWGRSMGAIFQG